MFFYFTYFVFSTSPSDKLCCLGEVVTIPFIICLMNNPFSLSLKKNKVNGKEARAYLGFLFGGGGV